MRRAALAIALLLTVATAAAQTAPASAPQPAASVPTAQATAAAQQASLLGQVSEQAGDLVVNALSQIGVRYRWGGNGDGSFDCSGLVQHVYQQTVGLVLPHNAKAQSKEGVKVAADDLQPGDLVFFKTLRRTISHVGIYVGNGQFVHAPHTGATVQVDNLDSSYWSKRFITARRLLDASVDPVGTAAASQPGVAAKLAQLQSMSLPTGSSAARAATGPQLPPHTTAAASAPEARHVKPRKGRHAKKPTRHKVSGKAAAKKHKPKAKPHPASHPAQN